MKFYIINIFVFISCLAYSQGTTKTVTEYSGDVYPTYGINSPEEEFSMVINNGEAYFASSREEDLLNYKENNWQNSKKISVFKANINKIDELYDYQFKNIVPFNKVNIQYSHSGPIAFSITGDTLFYTQVPVKTVTKIKIFKPQLYYLIKNKKGRWSKKVISLPFNNPLYSFGHPYYDSRSKTLYFSSDIKGGKGGKDLYSSQIRNGQWSEIINLKAYNSSANDMYPYIGDDKTFFFSSDRELGKGGLDIYYKSTNNIDIRNLTFLNSEKDDFGIYMFNKQTLGFLSSNRNGSDDIFVFSIKRENNILNSFSGKFAYRNLENNIETPLKAFLIDSYKNKVDETFVSEDGYFEFNNIDSKENYTIKAESEEPMELQIFNNDGSPKVKYISDENNDFVYELLDINDLSSLNLTHKDLSGNTIIEGRLMNEDDQFEDQGNLTVNLIDENGEIAYTTSTDSEGKFTFNKLPEDSKYIIEVEKEDSDLTLLIFNENGKIVEKLKDDGSGQFLYRKLKLIDTKKLKPQTLLYEDEFVLSYGSLKGDFDVKGEDGDFKNGLDVGIYDKTGDKIDDIKTNSNGQFEIKKIGGIDDYIFKLEEIPEEYEMEDFTLKLNEDNSDKTTTVDVNEDGTFNYRLLKINTFDLMAQKGEEEEEFNMNASLTYGKVKYNQGDTVFSEPLKINVYNESNDLLHTKTTDLEGNFNFMDNGNNDSYKIKITENNKDINYDNLSIDIVDNDVVKQNIEKNTDGDFIYRKLEQKEVTLEKQEKEFEDELGLIFTIGGDYDYDNKEGSFLPGLKVIAFDGNGVQVAEGTTNETGEFIFNNLPGLTNVLFKIDELPENFDYEKFTLYVKDETGKKVAKLQSSEKGYFVYKPLGFNVDVTEDVRDKLNGKSEDIFDSEALDNSNKIESVYFGSNKTNPNSSDMLKIEKILILLQISSTSVLEINAYADSRASDKYNLILSERRAKWIKDYLVRKGIDSSRIVINAYGEGRLVNDCADGVDCGDKQHALNRRAELRLIN